MFYNRLAVSWFLGAVLFAPAASYAFDVGPVSVNGFLSQGYLNSSGNNFLSSSRDGTTQFNEMAITVSSQVSDKLRVGMQLLSRDLGPAGNNEIRLDWGFGDYRYNDLIGVRAGKVKLPMGLYNEGRDSDFTRPMIFLPQSIYDENKRDLMVAYKGIGLYGNVPAGPVGDFDYHVYGGSIDYFMDSGQAKGLKQQVQTIAQQQRKTVAGFEISNRYVYGGSLIYNTPIDELRFGASLFTGKSDFDISLTSYVTEETSPGVFRTTPSTTAFKGSGNMKNNVVASMEYSSPNFTFVSEYIQYRAVRKFTIVPPIGSGISDGWYLLLSVPVKQFTLSGLYDVFYEDRNDRHGDRLPAGRKHQAWRKDLGLALRYDLNQNWTMKTEFHYIDGAANGTAVFNSQGVKRYWNYFAAKVSYNF